MPNSQSGAPSSAAAGSVVLEAGVVLYNSPPSVTHKQHHKALSNGLRCCGSCLELTAPPQPLARGSPAESAAEHCTGLRLLGEIQAAPMGSLGPSPYSSPPSLRLPPPLLPHRPGPGHGLPGPLSGQSDGWGAYPHLAVCRVLMKADPGRPWVLREGLSAQPSLEIGWRECSALLDCVSPPSAPGQRLFGTPLHREDKVPNRLALSRFPHLRFHFLEAPLTEELILEPHSQEDLGASLMLRGGEDGVTAVGTSFSLFFFFER